jgi:TP901 family phage tail tape measure protein
MANRTLGEALVKITASLKPLEKKLKQAKTLTTSTSMSIAGSIGRNMTKALDSIARTVKKVAKVISVALVAAFGLAIREAVKFEKQLAFVNTMLDDRTEPIMAQFGMALNAMAKTFGQSTQTLSKGLFDILSASIDAEKALGVLEISARSAVAGMTDTGIAADIITTIINSYGLAAEDAADISDKLFSTVKRGKTTFPELAQALGRVTSTASIAGMGLEELLATVATLTRAGVQTAEAVTSINGVLRAFLSPTEEAVMAAEEFGLELSSNTLKTIGFLGAVQKLNGAEAEQLAAIIPNIRAFKALAGALKSVEGLEKDFALISEESAGKTQEAFEKMANTSSFKIAQVGERIKATGRAFGEPLLGPLDRLLEKLSFGLATLEVFFRENQTLITQWGDLANQKINDVLTWFSDLLAVIRDEGWQAGLEKIGVAITQALRVSFEFIKPVAIEIGELMAEGFISLVKRSVNAALENTATGQVLKGNITAETVGGFGRAVTFPLTAGSEATVNILKEIARNTQSKPAGSFP